MSDSPLWRQFRRLLLGTILEVLGEHDVDVQLSSIQIDFDGDSAFKVPRLNNYMRFSGSVDATLHEALSEPALAELERALHGVWPEVLSVVVLPIGDQLTETRNEVTVAQVGMTLRIRFDLVAD